MRIPRRYNALSDWVKVRKIKNILDAVITQRMVYCSESYLFEMKLEITSSIQKPEEFSNAASGLHSPLFLAQIPKTF
jgi:hypothetical protein